jgi:hypothetical protein
MECWWYIEEGQQLGPVSSAVIHQRLQAGDINASTPVWQEGMVGWQSLGAIPTLYGPLQPPPGDDAASPPTAQTAEIPTQQISNQGRGSGRKILFTLALAAGVALLIVLVSRGSLVFDIWQGYRNPPDLQQHAINLPPPNIPPAQQKTEREAAPDTAQKPVPRPATDIARSRNAWHNPISGKDADIGADWVIRDDTRLAHKAIFAHTFSIENNHAIVSLIGEKISPISGLRDIATAFRQTNAKEYQFIGTEQYFGHNGVMFWESDARNRKMPDALVHIQITIVGTHAWTMISTIPSHAQPQDTNRLYALSNQLWKTVM